MAKETKKYTAAELIDMIRARYDDNAYAVLEQVAAGTGAGANSWIDAAVFSLWPSKGLWRAAMEVKVSRADWLKEMSQPAKNEWAREHFDFFWYVVAPGVVKDGECPEACGLMVVRGDGLTISKQAPRRAEVKNDASIIASFARSLVTEKKRFKQAYSRKIIENDYNYRLYKEYYDGVDTYFRRCGCAYYSVDGAPDVTNKLIELASSPEAKHDTAEAEAMLDALESLQRNVVDFLVMVAPLAANLLNARDETGRMIVDRYGWAGKATGLEDLRKALKTASRGSKEVIRKTISVRELLAEHADKSA